MKRFLILGLLLSTAQFQADAKLRHVVYDDGTDFWGTSSSLFDTDPLFNHYAKPNISESEKQRRKDLKIAQKGLKKIHPKISQTEDSITVSFSIPDTDKNNINISIKEGAAVGVIPSKYGKVSFVAHPNYIEINKTLEIKSPETNESKTSDNSQIKPKSHFVSTASFAESLPASVEINSIKASTQDDVLTVTFAKKKEKKINIKHSITAPKAADMDSK